MIKLVIATLSGCFKMAMIKRMIDLNPMEYIEVPKAKPKKKSIALTLEQQKMFLEYAKDNYLYPLFRVALMSGLRNGELRALRWCDLDLSERRLYVYNTLIWKDKEGYFLDLAKTESSQREIPMNEDLYHYLWDLKKCADGKGIGKPSDYVFCLPDGSVISRARVTSALNNIQAKMRKDNYDIPHFTCHAFRHTYATRAGENQMEPQELKALLGHKNISITLDLYSHVLNDKKSEAVKKTNGIF